MLYISEMEQQPDQRGAIQYHEQYENDMQEAIVALSEFLRLTQLRPCLISRP